MCLSRIPNASYRKYSKTIPNCVSAKFQSHLSEKIQRQFQIVSKPNSNRISVKTFSDNSKLCLSQIPIASHGKYSKTFPNYVFVFSPISQDSNCCLSSRLLRLVSLAYLLIYANNSSKNTSADGRRNFTSH